MTDYEIVKHVIVLQDKDYKLYETNSNTKYNEQYKLFTDCFWNADVREAI